MTVWLARTRGVSLSSRSRPLARYRRRLLLLLRLVLGRRARMPTDVCRRRHRFISVPLPVFLLLVLLLVVRWSHPTDAFARVTTTPGCCLPPPSGAASRRRPQARSATTSSLSSSTSLRRRWGSSSTSSCIHPRPHSPLNRRLRTPRSPTTTRLRAAVTPTSSSPFEGRPNEGDETHEDGDPTAVASANKASRKRLRRRNIVLPAIVQLAITLLCYGFHMAVLTTNSITFPCQLVPNAKGHFCGITYDSLVGMAVLIGYLSVVRPRRIRHQLRGRMMKSASSDSLPASATTNPQDSKEEEESEVSAPSSSGAPPPFLREPFPFPWNLPTHSVRWRISSLLALCGLVQAYFYAGRFSLFWEDAVLNLSGLGFYITAPTSRSLQVLMGHLTWVAIGSALLRGIPRPPPFFKGSGADHHQQGTSSGDHHRDDDSTTESSGVGTTVDSAGPYKWYQLDLRRSNWLLWTIGGYCVSSFLFNMADGINQYVVPPSLLLDQQETSVVSQLVTPEHNDVVASILAYVAPCVTAPWWEEILYRGFLLPVLSSAFGYPIAVVLQAIVFSAHHMSLTAFVPLLVLGCAWGVLYRECRNLWVPIFIHALWNSRVFFTSWLGI